MTKIFKGIGIAAVIFGLIVVVTDLVFATEMRGIAAAGIGAPIAGAGLVIFLVAYFISKKQK